MKTSISTKVLALVAVTVIFGACTGNKGQESSDEKQIDIAAMQEKYQVRHHFTSIEADTLLLEIVTYIGKKPAHAEQATRFQPEFRAHFRNQVPEYHFIYYHIATDSTHYVYLRRPARSLQGNQRGVAVAYRLADGLQINGFREVFNTPIFDSVQLYQNGYTLFQELIETGNADRFIGTDTLIEWPDHRMQYDTLLKEWRYVRDL